MKKLVFFLSLVIASACTRAQTTPPVIAPYKILTTNDVYTTPADLKKNKPVMLIYFAPDCGHCQKLINDMKPMMNDIKNVQVVMITFSDIRMVKTFQKDYGLTAWPNFTLGTEGYTYTVQKYYQLKHTPYIAIYDHKGKLVQAYEKPPEMKELLATIKKA
ncbi:TlpA family protein disulfide reductase [Mucilaginibacter phyllosphaerae]|nr:thioredoxin family protein [Mucilaginibacter phyllosphaerae]MBB3970448.1 thiol-disulfide isomerase/thioredoxin [Mucilaginibacter phyllosphaerae]